MTLKQISKQFSELSIFNNVSQHETEDGTFFIYYNHITGFLNEEYFSVTVWLNKTDSSIKVDSVTDNGFFIASLLKAISNNSIIKYSETITTKEIKHKKL